MKKPVRGQSKAAKPRGGAAKPAAGKAEPAKSAAGKHQRTVTVVNKRGLHARAAAKFVKLAGTFDAHVRVTAVKGGLSGSGTVSGSSIMGLMMLAAGPGSDLLIEAEGGEGLAALSALTRLVAGGFEEDD